jgi:nucleotide-binding universal stress UspA family protein
MKFSNILVAIDGSETSMRAAEYAINLSETKPARKTRRNCSRTSCINSNRFDKIAQFIPCYHIRPPRDNRIRGKRKEAQQWLDKVKTLSKEQNYNIRNFKSVIIEDILSRVGYAIVNYCIVNYAESQSIDLIVIGTRGRTGLRKMLLGSVVSDVLNYAHCPALVVRI